MRYLDHTLEGLTFDKPTHTYHYNEKQFFGITELLRKWIFPKKYAVVPEHVLQAAATRGSRIHEDIDFYFKNKFKGIVTFAPREVDIVEELLKSNGLFMIDTEVLVTDFDSRATAIDNVMFDNKGRIALADTKTTSELDMLYLSWQLSVNAVLYELCFKARTVHKLYAIWLPKDLSKAQMVEVQRLPDDEVWRFLQAAFDGAETFETEYKPKLTEQAPEALSETIEELVRINKAIDELNAEKNRLLDIVTPCFLSSEDKAWEGEGFKISRVQGGVRKTFDSARFKAEHGDIYEQYVKETYTTDTVRIKYG